VPGAQQDLYASVLSLGTLRFPWDEGSKGACFLLSSPQQADTTSKILMLPHGKSKENQDFEGQGKEGY
jgi:hypothetical protein